MEYLPLIGQQQYEWSLEYGDNPIWFTSTGSGIRTQDNPVDRENSRDSINSANHADGSLLPAEAPRKTERFDNRVASTGFAGSFGTLSFEEETAVSWPSDGSACASQTRHNRCSGPLRFYQMAITRPDDAIIRVSSNPGDPLHKFLQENSITLDSLASNSKVLDLLVKLPRKSREKYGPRGQFTEEEKKSLSRERNRQHAKFTRYRRKVIEKVKKLLLEEKHSPPGEQTRSLGSCLLQTVHSPWRTRIEKEDTSESVVENVMEAGVSSYAKDRCAHILRQYLMRPPSDMLGGVCLVESFQVSFALLMDSEIPENIATLLSVAFCCSCGGTHVGRCSDIQRLLLEEFQQITLYCTGLPRPLKEAEISVGLQCKPFLRKLVQLIRSSSGRLLGVTGLSMELRCPDWLQSPLVESSTHLSMQAYGINICLRGKAGQLWHFSIPSCVSAKCGEIGLVVSIRFSDLATCISSLCSSRNVSSIVN